MLLPAVACAIIAQWDLDPISGDWNTAANWTPMGVPNGPADTATFALSNTTNVSISANTEVNGITFTSAATNPYTITASASLGITGKDFHESILLALRNLRDLTDRLPHFVHRIFIIRLLGNDGSGKISFLIGSANDNEDENESYEAQNSQHSNNCYPFFIHNFIRVNDYLLLHHGWNLGGCSEVHQQRGTFRQDVLRQLSIPIGCHGKLGLRLQHLHLQ